VCYFHPPSSSSMETITRDRHVVKRFKLICLLVSKPIFALNDVRRNSGGRWRQWKQCGRRWGGLPSSTAADPVTGISLSPGSPRRSLRRRSSAPAKKSNSVAEDDARRLRRERAVAEDVAHHLQRERSLASVAEVHEELVCPDAPRIRR